MRASSLLVLIASLAAACGGNTQPAASPADDPIESGAHTPAVSAETTSSEASTRTPEGESPAADKPSSPPEPAFTENMSVAEAEKAVPPGLDRANLDPETLAKPLQNLDVYEPCKPPAGAKVKMRVAVWDGRAVGVDVTTTPKNDQLADCIRGKIRELSWDKKLESLNTIEYQF